MAGSRSSTVSIAPVSGKPLLIRSLQAAGTVNVSLRTWRMWDSQGLIPRGIKVGRTRFWKPDELKAWVEAGCPSRKDWEAMNQ